MAEYRIQIDGINRLVEWPNPETPIREREAIPLDAYHIIESVFEHAGPEFVNKLWDILWADDLIKPVDFVRPQNVIKINRAIKRAVSKDALNIIQKVQEGLNG